jgi:predicted kinase/mRNA-degrading endonuclease toxin of MazEF toxin-antitoxin module
MMTLTEAYQRRLEELECRDASCAPPPVGTGGSSSGYARRGVVPGYGPRALKDVRLSGVKVTYSPDHPDGGPDPGEIVWAKIPFEDDPTQSKDRPVLVIGRVNGSDTLAAVQLTSQTKGRRSELPIGSGDWDKSGKESNIKLDRVVQVGPSNYRREGSVMERKKFDHVIGHLAAYHRTTIEDFACTDASCAPPPVGTGGSNPTGSKRWTGLSPSPDGRRKPRAAFRSVPADQDDLDDLGYETTHDLARDIWEQELDNGYSTRVYDMAYGRSTTTRTDLTVGGVIMDANGHQVGTFVRIMHVVVGNDGKATIKVEHDYLNLDQEHHGMGIADQFNSNAIKKYQEIGVDSIELHAAMSVGPYAWARQGFRIKEDIQQEWVTDRAKAVRNVLDDGVKAGRWTESQVSGVKATATSLINAVKRGEDVQPIHLASLGEDDPNLRWELDGHPMWPGKRVLVQVDGDESTDVQSVLQNERERGYAAGSAWYGSYYFDANNVVSSARTDLGHVAHRAVFGASSALVEALQRRAGYTRMVEENLDLVMDDGETFRFNPSQPRDREGKWTSFGGSMRSLGGGRPGMGDRHVPTFGPEDSASAHIDPITGKFTPERQKLHDGIVEKLLSTAKRQAFPEYVMMGGGGGAGKTTAIRAGLIGRPEDDVILNADDIKDMLPEAKQMQADGDPGWAAFTHEESSYLVDRARRAAFERGLNVTMDATGSNPARVKAQADMARSMGYSVRAAYVTIPVEVGVQRAQKRFDDAVAAGKPGRKIPVSTLEQAHIGANRTFHEIWRNMDSAVLVDNTTSPTIVARTMGGTLMVENEELWEETLRRGGL